MTITPAQAFAIGSALLQIAQSAALRGDVAITAEQMDAAFKRLDISIEALESLIAAKGE